MNHPSPDPGQRVVESLEALKKLEANAPKIIEALETCTPGDYSTGTVLYPSFDEKKIAEVEAFLRETFQKLGWI